MKAQSQRQVVDFRGQRQKQQRQNKSTGHARLLDGSKEYSGYGQPNLF